jgi:hypothetical protein
VREIVVPAPVEVAGLSGAELDRALLELEIARRKLEAAYLAVLDRADSMKRYVPDGHASVRGWALALTDASPAETQRRLQTVRALREMPELAESLAAGRVGVDHVREIAKVHANRRVQAMVVDGEDRLVDHARRGFQHLSEVLARWVQFGDPDGARDRHDRIDRERDAKVFERDGVVHVHARCGSAQGAALLEIFARQCDAEFVDDWESAKTVHGDRVGPGVLGRTDAQRRCDALVHLVERAVATPPGSQPPEPIVNYVITRADHDAELAAMAIGTPVPAAGVDDVDRRRCETSTGVAVDPRQVVLASLTGWIRRMVVADDGRVLDLGRKRRFTGGSRLAVELGDGRRCIWPGCGRTSKRNHVDHTHPHAHGGLTRPDNGGPACQRHNNHKTRGYTVHRDHDGSWHIHRPDGTEVTWPAIG